MDPFASSQLTFLVPCYNEESRIGNVLAHAIQWADEVLVIDKSSTDRTAEVARSYGPKVQVLTVPFSLQGNDNARQWVTHAENDWIFVGTCSEIPTRHLVAEVRSLLAKEGGRLELIYIPRRMYSLGIHDPHSPWNVSYYPFLIHRKRAIITDVIHEHFRARDPANTATIPYSEECCVHHLTHPSGGRFIDVHAEYARVEAAAERDLDLEIIKCFKRMRKRLPGIFRTGPNWTGIYAAWSLYNMMNVLFIWERQRGLDVPSHYRQLTARLLADEWGVETEASRHEEPLAPSPVVSNRSTDVIQAELHRMTHVVYMVANISYYMRHPKVILKKITRKLKRRQ